MNDIEYGAWPIAKEMDSDKQRQLREFLVTEASAPGEERVTSLGDARANRDRRRRTRWIGGGAIAACTVAAVVIGIAVWDRSDPVENVDARTQALAAIDATWSAPSFTEQILSKRAAADRAADAATTGATDECTLARLDRAGGSAVVERRNTLVVNDVATCGTDVLGTVAYFGEPFAIYGSDVNAGPKRTRSGAMYASSTSDVVQRQTREHVGIAALEELVGKSKDLGTEKDGVLQFAVDAAAVSDAMCPAGAEAFGCFAPRGIDTVAVTLTTDGKLASARLWGQSAADSVAMKFSDYGSTTVAYSAAILAVRDAGGLPDETCEVNSPWEVTCQDVAPTEPPAPAAEKVDPSSGPAAAVLSAVQATLDSSSFSETRIRRGQIPGADGALNATCLHTDVDTVTPQLRQYSTAFTGDSTPLLAQMDACALVTDPNGPMFSSGFTSVTPAFEGQNELSAAWFWRDSSSAELSTGFAPGALFSDVEASLTNLASISYEVKHATSVTTLGPDEYEFTRDVTAVHEKYCPSTDQGRAAFESAYGSQPPPTCDNFGDPDLLTVKLTSDGRIATVHLSFSDPASAQATVLARSSASGTSGGSDASVAIYEVGIEFSNYDAVPSLDDKVLHYGTDYNNYDGPSWKLVDGGNLTTGEDFCKFVNPGATLEPIRCDLGGRELYYG